MTHEVEKLVMLAKAKNSHMTCKATACFLLLTFFRAESDSCLWNYDLAELFMAKCFDTESSDSAV